MPNGKHDKGHWPGRRGGISGPSERPPTHGFVAISHESAADVNDRMRAAEKMEADRKAAALHPQQAADWRALRKAAILRKAEEDIAAIDALPPQPPGTYPCHTCGLPVRPGRVGHECLGRPPSLAAGSSSRSADPCCDFSPLEDLRDAWDRLQRRLRS